MVICLMAMASLSPPLSAPAAQETSKYPLGFLFFLVTTVTLFVRPSEIVPSLGEITLYQYAIVICLLFSAPAVLQQLSPRALLAQPILFCLFGLLGVMVISAVWNDLTYLINVDGIEFLKIVLFVVLLVSLVDSTARLRKLMLVVFISTSVLAVLSLLQWHGVIEVQALTPLREGSDDIFVFRLRGTGIFNDPNDYSLILLVALLIGLYLLADRQLAKFRPWVIPALAALAYAFILTRSRGGFLALLAALVVLCRTRYTWKRTILTLAAALPFLFAIAASRQTEISTTTETGQDRLQLWSAGFEMFRSAPFFGVGSDQYQEIATQVAHNSYLHAFAELGVFGGVFFAGMFIYAVGVFHRLRTMRPRDGELARMRPYLMSAVAGYAVGLLSLSRNYVAPTYLIVGMAGAYFQMAVQPTPKWMRCGVWLFAKLTAASLGLLVFLYVVMRFAVHWSYE